MSSAAVHQSSPAQQQQYTGTPSSSRRPASRPDNASLAHSPQQQQPQYSSSAMTSPRGSQMQGAGMSNSTYEQFYPEGTASIPNRTSSKQTTNSQYDTREHSARTQPSQGQSLQGQSDSERERHGTDNERRRVPTAAQEEQLGGSKSQRTRNAPTSSRSQTFVGQPPLGTDLPRENSAVINRIVVDDPQTDRVREEARKAEALGHDPSAHMAGLSLNDSAEPAPVQRSRQEHLKHSSSTRKEVKFGDYILGQTIGEGEFGKVKMGWKKDSTVQVAIKLIRKESLAGNATRLPKIYREISILRELQHPNIVRLHEFVETERHMGIILEYASGGELFDYILNHRYLKDPAARRLFAQLVSGVGYLHQKGIVHRDLKLENLLLDRNKHIIITDFGFANTFDPRDRLSEDIENRIGDKEFVKRQGLDKIIQWQDGREGGHRRGDLMQTSCGSPCYAAPELVVSDGLYTGRKVDVWSCGVILYAMLAGYLPFDDDPANPEGDNINLLYKYIVSTPLTFPEYVTPHARDLLRRILVPDPRRRADLFEVARHSWLSEYTHVVGFISSEIQTGDIAHAAMPSEDEAKLGRSASVREPKNRVSTSNRASTSARHIAAASMGGDEASDIRKAQRDAKRRTVQVEYVPPQISHPRGEASPEPINRRPLPVSAVSGSGKTRARPEDSGPVEVSSQRHDGSMQPPPSRTGRDQARIASADTSTQYGSSVPNSITRPNTSGTLGGTSRLPSRGNSYSQPAAAQPTNTTAQGSFSQPKSSSGYIIAGSGPMSSEPGQMENDNRPHSEQVSGGRLQSPQPSYISGKPSGHRRSSTLGSLADKVLNRSNSKRQSQQEAPVKTEKRDKRYPPVSMKNAMPHTGEEAQPRPSSDGRRPSFGFNRKASKEGRESITGRRSSRRFSWLPGSLSMSNFVGKKSEGYDSGDDGYRPSQSQQSNQSNQSRRGRPESKGMAFGRGATDSPSQTTDSTIPLYYEEDREKAREQRRGSNVPAVAASKNNKDLPPSPAQFPTPPPVQRKQYRDDGYGLNRLETEPVERYYTPDLGSSSNVGAAGDQYNIGTNGQWEPFSQGAANPPRDQSLRPNQRRFGDAYDHGHGGSSSATRRVMDFFRRRGKERSEA